MQHDGEAGRVRGGEQEQSDQVANPDEPLHFCVPSRREPMNPLSGLVDAHRPGEQVAVVVRRGGQDVTLQVTLGNRPQQVTQG